MSLHAFVNKDLIRLHRSNKRPRHLHPKQIVKSIFPGFAQATHIALKIVIVSINEIVKTNFYV